MKRLAVWLVGMLLLSAAMAQEDSLFVVVTTDDAETQMMALVLATQSLQQDVPVRVLLCSAGGDLALRESESPIFEPAGASPKDLLQGLIERGVRVEVCAIYLPNRDVGEADLLEGVGIAQPGDVAQHMRQPGVRYFTF